MADVEVATTGRRNGRRGTFVVIAGPDGAGKTTVVDALVGAVLMGPLLGLHHRPRVLGGLTEHDGEPVTEPHAQTAYSRPVSIAKLGYLYLDHLLGWLVKVRPWLHRGGDVVLERGWWDLLVDPRRYRLRPMPGLVRLLGTLLPRPDVTLVLVGDATIIAARKGELSVEETGRQLEAWRRVPAVATRVQYIDVCRPLNEMQERARRAVLDSRDGRWVGLPTASNPRWILPTAPSQVVVGAFAMYNPVTTRGRYAREAARRAAMLGGFRLLRSRLVEPPNEVLDILRPHLPDGARLGVAQGNHPGRSTALILDGSSGTPLAFAKLATDEAGRDALDAEADSAVGLTPLLPPGLSSPRLLYRERGLILFEGVAPVPRRRAWRLEPEVAALLGRFYRNGAAGDLGPAHGDCAPWNLLLTAAGWSLVDWADARRDAPAFEDLFHHLVQSHALLGRPRADVVLEGVAAGRGPVGELVRAYAAGAEVDVELARPLFLSYLDRSSSWMELERPDGRAGARAREALRGSLRSRGSA